MAAEHLSIDIARRHGTAVALRPAGALVPVSPPPVTVVVDELQQLLARTDRVGQDLRRHVAHLLECGRVMTRPHGLRRLPDQVATVEELGC